MRSNDTLTVMSVGELPPPARSDLVAADRDNLIGPLDTVDISVFNVPELTRELQVDGGGRISMPLIGTIEARGHTPRELAIQIEAALRGRFVKNPDVTVNLKNAISQVVTVDGEVREPGPYPVTNQSTLLRSIAAAKGLSEFAKLDDIVILRTVGTKRLAAVYNLTAVRRGTYADPAIYANDVIIVGDSAFRRRFKDFIGLAPLLSAPIIALLR
jgi:polysaccharide biosynthesis/export protein